MTGNAMSIFCYECYKSDWKKTHKITKKKEMESLKSYYDMLADDNITEDEYTYDDYLTEFGYNGELYVCYEEFLDNEYLYDYDICNYYLGKDEELIKIYHDTVNSNKKEDDTDKNKEFLSCTSQIIPFIQRMLTTISIVQRSNRNFKLGITNDELDTLNKAMDIVRDVNSRSLEQLKFEE